METCNKVNQNAYIFWIKNLCLSVSKSSPLHNPSLKYIYFMIDSICKGSMNILGYYAAILREIYYATRKNRRTSCLFRVSLYRPLCFATPGFR